MLVVALSMSFALAAPAFATVYSGTDPNDVSGDLDIIGASIDTAEGKFKMKFEDLLWLGDFGGKNKATWLVWRSVYYSKPKALYVHAKKHVRKNGTKVLKCKWVSPSEGTKGSKIGSIKGYSVRCPVPTRFFSNGIEGWGARSRDGDIRDWAPNKGAF